MAAGVLRYRLKAHAVDRMVETVVRDEGLDLGDPVVARAIAALRARLDQATILIRLRPEEECRRG